MALVTIGTQTWTVENLDVDTFGDGTPIMEVSSSDQWETAGRDGVPAWCYYNFDSSNASTYGRLYNFYVVSASISARNIVANPQFKVPTAAEYATLASYLGGRTPAGRALKNTENWLTNTRMPGNGSNTSGWTGNPGGFLKDNGESWDLGWSGNFWTKTTGSSGFTSALSNKLYYGNTTIQELTAPSALGFSIRLILSGSWGGGNGYNPSENYG
jgi:uncharacterized protein (TIGR02145 family)